MSALALNVATPVLTARAQAMQAFLDAGDGAASIDLMAGAYPGAGVTGGVLLGTVALAKPCGTVDSGVLTLTAADANGATVLADGEALWARCKAASGAWAFDMAVTVEGGAGGLVLRGAKAGPAGGVLLYAGGRLPPVTLRIV
jgi:hypothetical protein